MTKKHIKNMLRIANYQRNASQNELSPYTSEDGHHQKNIQTINVGEDVEKREPSRTVGGNVSHYSYYGELYGGFLRN